MARILKGVYFKASHVKLRSYATKANPYVEVLKTLRSWEQDLRNRSKILPNDIEEKVLNDKHYLSRQAISLNGNRILNGHNEDLHLREESSVYSEEILNKTSEKSFDKTSKLENSEMLKERQQLETKSKNLFQKKETIGIPFAEHSSDKLISLDESKNVNEFTTSFSLQENTDTVNPRNSKERTTNKNVCDNEPQKTTKRKSKKSKLKQTNLSINDSKNLNKHIDVLNPKNNAEMTSFSSLKERTADTTTDKELQSVKKKNLPRKGVQTPNAEHLSSKSVTINESEDVNKFSTTSNTKDSIEFINSYKMLKERTANKNICSSELPKVKNKSKKSKVKSKNELCVNKENQKKRAKQENAIESLKSLIDAYINANEINKAQRTFEYLNQDIKKKEFIDIDLYNMIISGWAQQGRLDKVKHLFFLMTNDKIIPNLQSYASYLEAISRSKCVDVAEIPKILNQMKLQGFSPKELLQKCIFVGDQREKVLEALGFVERDLSLPLYVPEEAYSYKLLEKLNDNNYEKGESHFNFCFQAEEIPKLSSSQMEIECLSTVKIKSMDTVTELTDKIISSREYIKECENMWRERLTKVIDNLKSPKRMHQGILGLALNQSIFPYLKVIDTEVLVSLLLQETRMLGETAEFYSPNIKVLYRELGLKVMRHYFMALNKKNKITDKVHFIYQKYLSYLLDPDLCAKYSPREYWKFLKSKYSEGPTIDISNANWPYSLLIFIGSILYDVLRSNICFNPNKVNRKSNDNFMYPAFHLVYENHDVKLNRQIRAHDMFSKLYRDAKLDYLEFDVSLVPMLSPPRPWVKYDSGGLLITKVPFIRFPEQARSQNTYYSTVPSHQLNPCFDSLNNLSVCPWIINKPILDIVIKIFQEGGSEELDIPLNPVKFQLDPSEIKTLDEKGRIPYKYKMEYEKKKSEMTSLWFDCLYKLSIANHFQDKVFWFPHNLDFRGRVYPTPPHFNHLGSDLSRSILLFAAGKPLGKKGLDWLKIHLINLTGFKKRAPHTERLEYANELLAEILDSADNPFGASKWWMKSDKPLQTLACCKEVASAVRHPNPEEYISHFPVHQDGSCNGLQHYAALGRDELGAIEVNLHPSNSPQDVYSGVAALVEKERERDANMGLEIAVALEGFVTRKVVKQTVMTFVYGVTPYGARLQVLKQLKDMPEFPEKYQHAAASYLMKKIFLSIKEMFTATKRIQDWFTDCAEEITRVTDDAVEWITPLGLPVIQPYYKETVVRSSKFCLSKGNKENINHYVSHFEPYQLPNIRKQKNAFAPNFIHSLDSTHMMLTSLFCHRKGVTFVSVHDCYWTHASTVQAMNKICREQFVSLHNEPILENLSAFFMERYANNNKMSAELNQKQIKAISKLQDVLSAVPDKGTFNLNQVLNSEYFFS